MYHSLIFVVSIIRSIAKTGGVEILKALKDGPLSWNELLKKANQNSNTLSYRTREFIQLKLIEEELVSVQDSPRRRKVYVLTPTGKRILELIEEIEKAYNVRISEDEKFEREAEEHLYGETK